MNNMKTKIDFIKPWLISLTFWMIPILIMVGWLFTNQPEKGPGLMLVRTLPYYVPWILVSPLVVKLAGRYPLSGDNKVRQLMLHLMAGVAIAASISLYLFGLEYLTYPDKFSGFDTWTALTMMGNNLPMNIIIYGLLLGLGLILDSRHRARERQHLLTMARLEMLKARVQPHFLFNALNAVSTKVDIDPKGAKKMLAALGELLRAGLSGDKELEVPLERELHLLDLYLNIEKVRFSDRLRVEQDISPDLRDVMVPQLILQPIVENAVRHGLGARLDAGRLQIGARLVEDKLHLIVADDGPGFPATGPEFSGIGLVTVRDRLKESYGEQARLRLETADLGGARVVLELPLRRE